jgi:hypothetical protein
MTERELPPLKAVRSSKRAKYKPSEFDVSKLVRKEVKKVIKKIQDDGPEVKMQQLYIAPWGRDGDVSYSVIGLSVEGKVYRWDGKCTGWIPWNMHEAECAAEHKK